MQSVDGEPQQAGRGSPARAMADVSAVFVAVLGTMWIASRTPGWAPWERDTFGGLWLVQILALMIVPLLVVRLLGWRPGRLGVTFGDIGRPAEAGLTALVVVGPASGLAFPLLGMLGWTPFDWAGGLVLAGVYAVSLPLTGLVLRKLRPTSADSLTGAQLTVAAGVLAAGLVAALLTADAAPLVSRVLIGLLVVGPGEELVFRGIVQTRLDQAFGRPWRVFGADLGWGWVLASLIFGLAHFLSPVGAGQGGWALWTAVAGLLFGYVRAKGGSFVASGIVHGVLLAVSAVFTPVP
ncbi:MAG: CPBP family intramembrane metalloprotease [Micropruina sp.]|uniref:CPBP family glutamic-type intramembrane protease n=1 Tax=Micropruina sp. TaxID=2737536 RepID=UPI0039E5CFC8